MSTTSTPSTTATTSRLQEVRKRLSQPWSSDNDAIVAAATESLSDRTPAPGLGTKMLTFINKHVNNIVGNVDMICRLISLALALDYPQHAYAMTVMITLCQINDGVYDSASYYKKYVLECTHSDKTPLHKALIGQLGDQLAAGLHESFNINAHVHFAHIEEMSNLGTIGFAMLARLQPKDTELRGDTLMYKVLELCAMQIKLDGSQTPMEFNNEIIRLNTLLDDTPYKCSDIFMHAILLSSITKLCDALGRSAPFDLRELRANMRNILSKYSGLNADNGKVTDDLRLQDRNLVQRYSVAQAADGPKHNGEAAFLAQYHAERTAGEAIANGDIAPNIAPPPTYAGVAATNRSPPPTAQYRPHRRQRRDNALDSHHESLTATQRELGRR